jgi:hypothetical protein
VHFSSLNFSYSGNTYLGIEKQKKKHLIIIISALLGISFLLAAALCCYMLTRKTIRKNSLESQNGEPPTCFVASSNSVVSLCSETLGYTPLQMVLQWSCRRRNCIIQAGNPVKSPLRQLIRTNYRILKWRPTTLPIGLVQVVSG